MFVSVQVMLLDCTNKKRKSKSENTKAAASLLQSKIVPRSLSSLFICKIEKQWKEKVKANEKQKGKRTKKDT